MSNLNKEDESFLGYVWLRNSRTERHAFSHADARKLMHLAGVERIDIDDPGIPGFVGIPEADTLIKQIRKQNNENRS